MQSTRAISACLIGFFVIAVTQGFLAAPPPEVIAAVKIGDGAAVKRSTLLCPSQRAADPGRR